MADESDKRIVETEYRITFDEAAIADDDPQRGGRGGRAGGAEGRTPVDRATGRSTSALEAAEAHRIGQRHRDVQARQSALDDTASLQRRKVLDTARTGRNIHLSPSPKTGAPGHIQSFSRDFGKAGLDRLTGPITAIGGASGLLDLVIRAGESARTGLANARENAAFFGREPTTGERFSGVGGEALSATGQFFSRAGGVALSIFDLFAGTDIAPDAEEKASKFWVRISRTNLDIRREIEEIARAERIKSQEAEQAARNIAQAQVIGLGVPGWAARDLRQQMLDSVQAKKVDDLLRRHPPPVTGQRPPAERPAEIVPLPPRGRDLRRVEGGRVREPNEGGR